LAVKNIFPESSQSLPMCKYKDKQQLLTLQKQCNPITK